MSIEVAHRVLSHATDNCRAFQIEGSCLPPYNGFIGYMLVCRAWCQLVAKQIWQEIGIITSADDAAYLLQHVWIPGSISASPRLVKSLYLHFDSTVQPSHPLHALLDCLSNVRVLQLAEQVYPTSYAPDVIQHLPTIMDRLPSVKHICLDMRFPQDFPPERIQSLDEQLVHTIQSRQLQGLQLSLNDVRRRILSPTVTNAILNSQSLHKLDVATLHPTCLPLLVRSPVARQLRELMVHFEPPSADQEAAWQYSFPIDNITSLFRAFEQLRVFSILQDADILLTSPRLWTFLEALSTLPHLTKLTITSLGMRHAHITLTKPSKMLTFPKLQLFNMACRIMTCTVGACGRQYLAHFQWPALKNLILVQGAYSDKECCQLLQNAPSLKSLGIVCTAPVIADCLQFLQFLAQGVYPSIVNVEIRWQHVSNQAGAEAMDDSHIQALQRAFPNAQICLDKRRRWVVRWAAVG